MIYSKDMTKNPLGPDNNNTATLFEFEDGESFVEPHRVTWGGWVNMTRRVEQRCGGPMRPVDAERGQWTVNGRPCKVTTGLQAL